MPESLKNQYQYHTKANLNKLIKSGYKKICIAKEGIMIIKYT